MEVGISWICFIEWYVTKNAPRSRALLLFEPHVILDASLKIKQLISARADELEMEVPQHSRCCATGLVFHSITWQPFSAPHDNPLAFTFIVAGILK
jgi:hypothetical protein